MSVFSVQKPTNNFIKGTITLNGSKSISNRVLIINALCNNAIEIENLSNADDTIFMQKILQSQETTLNAGAGGTTFRFLTAFLATQEGREVILTGSERLQQRPIKILVEALQQLGANIEYVNKTDFPPLRIKGTKLKGGKISLPANISSQFITALLLIAPQLEEGLELTLVGEIVSIPYINMTLKLMEYFGISTSFNGNIITIKNGIYKPKIFFVEGDWSAASYYYAIATMAQSAEIVLEGLTNEKIQGDSIVSKIFEQLNVTTTYQNNKISIQKTAAPTIQKLDFDFLECPDLAQTVVACCGAIGIEMNCQGLQTLRIKETDRIAALNTELKKLGLANFEETIPNNWKLSIQNNIPTTQQVVETYDDHRMAMAFAPLCLSRNGEILIADTEVVTKSYPMFWNDLKKLGFIINEI